MMDRKDREIFKKGIEKPSDDFTKNVLNQIDKEEEALAKVLSSHSMETPSDAFTSSIMQAISNKKVVEDKPIIGKSVWIGLAAVFIGLIVLVLGAADANGSGITGNQLENMFESLKGGAVSSIITYAALSAFGLSILLLIDQKLLKKKEVMN
jgi:hypothetical protein